MAQCFLYLPCLCCASHLRLVSMFQSSIAVRLTYSFFYCTAMAGLAPEGSQFDAKQYDNKMQELL